MALRPIHADFSRCLEEGLLLDEANFRRRAGLTQSKLDDAVRHGRLLRIEDADGRRAIPALHVDQSLSQVEVQAVLRLLHEFPARAQWLFLTTPKGSLATPDGRVRSPVEALRDGDFTHVLKTALGFTER